MKTFILFSRKLNLEYTRARKRLTLQFKKQLIPNEAKVLIDKAIVELTARQSRIIAYYLNKSFLGGIRDARKEIKDANVIAGAAAATVGFDLSSIADSDLRAISKANIGAIGKYNVNLSKELIKQYDMLLSDNKLINSLNREGWTPWLDKTLLKRGIDPAVISLVKQQKTSAKMIQILNDQGIKGGMHPDQVARRLIPHINRYFGPNGVEINNIGKTVKRFRVDADGNYGWFDHKITRKYRATPRNYSRLIARSAMKEAHREAYYQSLRKTNLVDHYISVSVMDARTCGDCSMMHGRRVSKADGPSYHGNCHCDLKPVWKRDSLLGDKNKPQSYYDKQRDMHFLRLNDLKRFNTTMPVGSMLKNYALLPDSAKSGIMPGPLQMVKIRHALMGEPAKITPIVPPEISKMSDAEWQLQSNALYAKTEKDGVEHLTTFSVDGSHRTFGGSLHECAYTTPSGSFSSLHTHPSKTFDSPLSEADFVSFLSQKNEYQMAACSNKHIYVLTKQKGAKGLKTSAQKQHFYEEFEYEQKKFFRSISAKEYSDADYHHCYLTVGKRIARRYNLDYLVIDRAP